MAVISEVQDYRDFANPRYTFLSGASQVALVVKDPPANAGDVTDCGLIPKSGPWVGKTPWRRAWPPTPVFLPGEPPWTEEPGGLQ